MEKILLHGDNFLASRQQLFQLKERLGAAKLEEINASKFSSAGTGFFERQLFGGQRFLLLEFFEKEELKRLDLEKLVSFLDGPDLPDGFIIWCGFELTPANPFLKILQKEKFRGTKVDVSVRVFKLVDAFFEPNRNLFKLYQLAGNDFEWDKEGIFLVLMLTKRTRQLLWSFFQVEALKKLHPYVQNKLTQRAPSFRGAVRLIRLYKYLAALENNLKGRFVDLESHFFLMYESLVA